MLAALLSAGLVAAPLASAGLLIPSRHLVRGAGAWAAVRRFMLALIGTAVPTAIVVATLRLLGVSSGNVRVSAIAVACMSALWLPFTRRWHARGHLCWSSTVFLFITYLVFILHWTLVSHLGTAGTAGGLLLWLFEVLAAVLACAYLWEICDALGTQHWRRRITGDLSAPATGAECRSGGRLWSRLAAGTNGASRRTPSCPFGCSRPDRPGCMWTGPGGTGSCR